MQRYNLVTIFVICFLYLANNAGAQITIHIESAGNHLPLPYASIVNLTKNELRFTNEEGNLTANFTSGDTIKISYVGYETLKTIFESKPKQVYILKQLPVELKEVQVENCRNWENTEFSNVINDPNERKFGGVSWERDTMNAKMAVLVAPGNKPAPLINFSIWLRRGFSAPKVAVKAPIKFSFCNVNDSSGLPGELISNRQIIYYPKKEGKQTINIDSIHIKIPANGMYVVIEYVIDEKYEWAVHMVDNEKGINFIKMYYGAFLDGVFAKDFPLAFYNYKNDNWSFPGHRTKNDLLNTAGTIKFSATISICKEN